MTPGAHLLASWLIADLGGLSQRHRRIISIAGLSPDIDGIGFVFDKLMRWNGIDTDYYFKYHHVFGHGFFAAIFVAIIASYFAGTRRVTIFLMALIVVHLHFICDLVGSRGPDGYQWPILYLYPFNSEYSWTWQGQWELSAWQNSAIILVMLLISICIGYYKKYSFVEVISTMLDREFFKMLYRYNLTCKK